MNYFQQTMKEIIQHLERYYSSTAKVQSIDKIIDIISSSEKIFVYGAGRSGMVGRMFAQRLMHLNLQSFYLSETITPAFNANDCLIVVSGSGETLTPKTISVGANKIGGRVILFTANPDSSIGKVADHTIIVEGQTKDVEQEALAPFTSLFDITALVVLDSITREIMNKLGKTETDILEKHASLE